ncbi:sigma-70 family RNA polymerase sigma factor [Blastococcus brunescens]|uniref:Sigma-70 family RNA polymerase sigma factor n=1 Tax=Blastococcus brunescens TaxID=1564165 RepID=A0ABZ1B1N5_9ACTN|nr:sigma-70 family RNA polymerase sigma factor [Blastococcus sp. BMG 8361]WRL63661.1 sigma-70 family RNA polymerase sigma factor [Blastococcus sp. BMG 8361]
MPHGSSGRDGLRSIRRRTIRGPDADGGTADARPWSCRGPPADRARQGVPALGPDRGDDPYPYVRRALVTTAASWRRRRTTQEIVSLPAGEPAASDPTDEVTERARMVTALASLPPRMRTVLVLRYAEDLSEAATAEVLGCAVATVKSQTVRGLARLRTALGATATAVLLEER